MSDVKKILNKYWGYSDFRPNQEQIINSVLNGHDTLALMPTGGGKSLCFQIPALAKDGICLVVSPLIALMKDQIQNLHAHGIKALAIYSGMTLQQIDIALDNAIYGDYKFIYVSPERLSSPLFKGRVIKMNVNFLVVDEAHCISQWGYDFRPAYLQIADIKKLIGDVTTVALTATATKEVAADIVEKLNMTEPNIVYTGFERDNLSYIIRQTDDKLGNLLKICDRVEGTGIIYTNTRKAAEEISKFLRSNSIVADFYHAGLCRDDRTLRQEGWKSGDIRVIVATNAFGMGIDKPDVRFVIHYDMPDSIEAYFQEAGRAGRDGLRSFATLLWNPQDFKRIRQIHSLTYPPIEYISQIYQKVFQFLQIPYEAGKDTTNKFNLIDFSQHFKLNTVEAYYAIKYIELEGYWELTDELDNPSRIMFIVSRDDLYKVQINNIQLDSFIKAILRLYTGLFSKSTPIDEDYIAKVTLDSVQNVSQKLITLSRMKIIQYIPRIKTPLIIMNNERLLESNFYLSPKNYQQRKDVMNNRIESMISFVLNNSVCRSRQLIEYFGMKSVNNCGICDVCLKHSWKSADIDRLKEIEKQINVLLLERKNIKIRDVEILGADNSKIYIEVLRSMIDRGAVTINGDTLSSSSKLGA